jgi:HK97 family phage major capsid protein/HK97 family phage prohead protease
MNEADIDGDALEAGEAREQDDIAPAGDVAVDPAPAESTDFTVVDIADETGGELMAGLLEGSSAERGEVVQVRGRSVGDMQARKIDGETRTVELSLSSEREVARWFGRELLVHDAKSIDLEFLASGRAPLLLDHDQRQQIGVIESVELSADRKLRAKVRFGRSAKAQEVFADVEDGIRANISVGYLVHEMQRDKKDRELYRVSRWSPLEVSVVSVPADTSVGIGRSASTAAPVTPSTKETNAMTDTVNIEAVRAEAAANAAKNATDILALAASHNKRDLGDKAIKDGLTIEQFRGALLDAIGTDKPLENTDIGLTRKEAKTFSLMRGIAAMLYPSDAAIQRAAAFEMEVAAAAATRYGRSAQGLMIPTDVLGLWNKRDINTTDDNELVATDLLASEFIDVLRNSMSVMQAGARMLPGLVGNVAIPKKATASTAGWISTEGGAASESEPTFSQVTLAPKHLGAFTDITRAAILQSTPAIEALIRDDLTQALALAIDKGALEGSGSSGQPTGVLNTVGINNPTDFAAAVPTFAEMVALETAVAEDNALFGNLAYITDAATYGGLKTKTKDAGSGMFVLENREANGYPVIRSQQATAGNVYFGNWSDCLIGMWAGLDILVDPYTASSSGTVRIRALQTVDVAVRNAVSFAVNNDGV